MAGRATRATAIALVLTLAFGCNGQVETSSVQAAGAAAGSPPSDAADALGADVSLDAHVVEDAALGDASQLDADVFEAWGCVAGDRRCNGNVPEVCTDDGGWTPLAPCAEPTPVCAAGKCQIQAICGASGWCWESPTPLGVYLASVHGFAPDNVWAVGAAGAVVHWDGQRWQAMPSPTDAFLGTIFGVAPEDLWVAGTNYCGHPQPCSCVLYHGDGAAWTQDPDKTCAGAIWGAAHDDLWAAYGASPKPDVYIGSLLHYDGVSRNTAMNWADKALFDIHGTSADNAWGVGSQGLVLHYDGTQWLEQSLGLTANLYDVWAKSPDNVWVVGSMGTTAHYDDTSWTTVPSPAQSSYLGAVWSPSPDEAWAGANSTPPELLRWNGQMWSSLPFDFRVAAMWGVGGNDAWGVGDGIAHLQSGTWTGARTSVFEAAYPFADIWGSGPEDVWIVGPPNGGPTSMDDGHWAPKDAFLHWDGTAWSHVLSGTEQILNAISGTSSKDIWAAGSDVMHWDGVQWSRLAVPIAGRWEDVWALATDDVWIAGQSLDADAGNPGLIAHWNGSSWSVSWPGASSVYSIVYSIWGVSSEDLWAASTTGLLHYDGQAWVQGVDGGSAGLRSVHGVTGADAWAVGSLGVIQHWDGTSWSSVESGTTRPLTAVHASAPDDAWAIGPGPFSHFGAEYAGVLLHWDGSSWSRVADAASGKLYGVWGPSKQETWAVGTSGTILHRRVK